MLKETFIVSIVVILIIIANIITQNYTKQSVETMSEKLLDLRSSIINKQKDNEDLIQKVNDIEKEWESMHDKLAYYIEHDELEKVETDLKGIKSNIETEEYNHTISDLDKCVFLLQHIEDKEKLNLKNIF